MTKMLFPWGYKHRKTLLIGTMGETVQATLAIAFLLYAAHMGHVSHPTFHKFIGCEASGYPHKYASHPLPHFLHVCKVPDSTCLCNDRSKLEHAVHFYQYDKILFCEFHISFYGFSLATTWSTAPCFSILNFNSGIFSNI